MMNRKLWKTICAALLCAALLCGTFAVAEDEIALELDADTANAAEDGLELEIDDNTDALTEDISDIELDGLDLALDDGLVTSEVESNGSDPVMLSNEGEGESAPTQAVPLSFTYNGPALTKVYDTTTNVFKKNASGEISYLITAPKAADFKVNESQLIPGHTNVMIKVTSIKKHEPFPKADVGSYTLTWTFGLQGDDANYYTPQPVGLPARITPREVVITPRAGLSKVYGTNDPVYKKDAYLSTDESSPLHQNIGGLPGYAIPLNVNSETGKLTISITNSAYILKEAEQKGKKFFPGWLTREKDSNPTHKGFDDVGRYKILIGDMKFSSNFAPQTLEEGYFTITPKDIGDDNVTVAKIADQTYTGKAIKPALTVRYGNMTLIKGKDYTVEYSNNTKTGTAKVKLTGKGNFKGTKGATFTIKPKNIGNANVTVDKIANQTYTGKAIKPALTVRYGTMTLKKDRDYTVEYSGNTKVGTAKVKLTGKGNFTGSRKITFKIVPRPTSISKLTPLRGRITVKWEKTSGVTGYQIAYSLKSDFSDKVKKVAKGATKKSLILKGLKSKKTYYIRIRTYKTVNDKKYYSAWSKAKKVTTK